LPPQSPQAHFIPRQPHDPISQQVLLEAASAYAAKED